MSCRLCRLRFCACTMPLNTGTELDQHSMARGGGPKMARDFDQVILDLKRKMAPGTCEPFAALWHRHGAAKPAGRALALGNEIKT